MDKRVCLLGSEINEEGELQDVVNYNIYILKDIGTESPMLEYMQR